MLPRWKLFRTLQAGRGVAAMMVVLYHSKGMLTMPEDWYKTTRMHFQVGRSGVTFFYVLSSIAIMHAHVRDLGFGLVGYFACIFVDEMLQSHSFAVLVFLCGVSPGSRLLGAWWSNKRASFRGIPVGAALHLHVERSILKLPRSG